MSRRIDIELTSALDDGTWTWRAAGARHPKGVVDGSILPSGAKVGDELKVEVEQEIDGITVLNVVHGRAKADRNDLIELLPAERDFQPVVETRAPGGRGPRRDGDRRPRRDGDGQRRPRRDRDGGDRREGRDGRDADARGDRRGPRPDGDRRPRREGGDRGDRRRGPSFTPPPEVPQRPRPQRLKAAKTHRNAVLAELPDEQRAIGELALQGLAAVRARVREDNKNAAAENRAQMPEQTVMKMAEELLPRLRVAEWRDRAEAAQRQLAQLDLRDLRSVVASANDPIVARDESTRALAQELTAALATKQDEELQLWYGDVDAALAVGRVIRALRLSSQPPKAGVPFPADIAQRLIDSTNASLAPMDAPDRWVAMLEAAAFSPVRAHIKPMRKPDVVSDELLATVKRLGPALPQVAELFEVEVDAKAPMPKPLRPGPRGKDARGAKPKPDAKDGDSKDKDSRGKGTKDKGAGSQDSSTESSDVALAPPDADDVAASVDAAAAVGDAGEAASADADAEAARTDDDAVADAPGSDAPTADATDDAATASADAPGSDAPTADAAASDEAAPTAADDALSDAAGSDAPAADATADDAASDAAAPTAADDALSDAAGSDAPTVDATADDAASDAAAGSDAPTAADDVLSDAAGSDAPTVDATADDAASDAAAGSEAPTADHPDDAAADAPVEDGSAAGTDDATPAAEGDTALEALLEDARAGHAGDSVLEAAAAITAESDAIEAAAEAQAAADEARGA